jgi:multidrug efflux system membrane fusion protein
MDDRPATNLRSDSFKPAHQKRAPRTRWRPITGGVVVVLLIVAAAWWIEIRPATQPAGGRPGGAAAPMSIVPATVEKGDIDIALNALGTVTSLSTVTVRTQITGQLLNIDFREGQVVKKDDPLAEIDSRPYEIARQQALGALARDQALLKDAQLDLARYKTLAAQNAIPKQQYDTQDALVHQYEGTVVSDQAQVDSAALNITYCHIVAPASGQVGLRQVDQGNYVTPADTNGIVLITQIQPITVIFTLPEDNLPAVLGRVHAGATLAATAYDRSATTLLGTGTLMTLDNQIDTTTGTVKLRAQFANSSENLFPNQFVNIKLLVDTLHDTTVMPTSAVQRGSPGTYVYLVNPDNTVSIRTIELGPANGERQSVRSGLSPGDRVVVDGADKLRDGAKIVVRDAAGGATPASANPGAQPRGARSQAKQPAAPNGQ